ncbi:MAG: four helix bundle protein [Bacteroidota bacterium]
MIEKFEDLKCWQESRVLVKMIYKTTANADLDLDSRRQMRRAALSTMNNIAEGFGRFSNKEFIRFLEISQSSGREVKSMLYVFLDVNYINKTEFTRLNNQVEKYLALTVGLIKYLQSKSKKP